MAKLGGYMGRILRETSPMQMISTEELLVSGHTEKVCRWNRLRGQNYV